MVFVKLEDDGGVENGGDDTSETQSFNIIVEPIIKLYEILS